MEAKTDMHAVQGVPLVFKQPLFFGITRILETVDEPW